MTINFLFDVGDNAAYVRRTIILHIKLLHLGGFSRYRTPYEQCAATD